MHSVTKAVALTTILCSVCAVLILWPEPIHAEEPTIQVVDRAGPYVIGNDKDRSKTEADVRDFIWSHWQEHRPGILRAIWTSKEGAHANTTYCLEPDRNGVWSLSVKTDWPLRKDTDRQHESVQFRVYSIRRIEPRRDGQSPAVFIPDGEVRPGNAYWLVFYDKSGKETGGV
jgi:hypothetical protein